MYFQNTNLIEIATFKTTQKYLKQRQKKLSKRFATTVETSNGKFHLIIRGNVPTNFIIDLYIIGSSFIRVKIQL